MKTIALVVLLVATASAGAPPSDVIPWDSTYRIDTITEDTVWIFFITRDVYRMEVSHEEIQQDVSEIKRDIQAIKALLKKKEKP